MNIKARQSNIELLRIISMLMILTVHVDGASLGLPEPSGNWSALTASDVWKLGVESIAIIGVNCFTMISGYFGIRLSLRTIFSFLFECIFYSVGIYIVFAIIMPARYSLDDWYESWLVLSHTDLWYVPAYFGLMILSPILNAGAKCLSRSTYTMMLLLFSLFTFWCGWWCSGRFNPTGYTILQLTYIYLCAAYIRKYVGINWLRERRMWWAIGFSSACICIFATSIYLPGNKAFAYNSPLVVLSAISFFALILTFEFKSAAVNYLAKSAFAVYLIHKSVPVWVNVMRPAVRHFWENHTLATFSLATLAIIASCYLLAVITDPVRRGLWRLIYCKLAEAKINLIHNYEKD